MTKGVTADARCSAMVPGGCSKRATVTEDTQLFCTIHAPSYIRAKNEKREEKFKEEREAWLEQDAVKAARSRQADLFPQLLAACKLAEPILDAASATEHESGAITIDGARPAWEAVKAALAISEGH